MKEILLTEQINYCTAIKKYIEALLILKGTGCLERIELDNSEELFGTFSKKYHVVGVSDLSFQDSGLVTIQLNLEELDGDDGMNLVFAGYTCDKDKVKRVFKAIKMIET